MIQGRSFGGRPCFVVEIYSYFANKRSFFIEMSQKVWYHITMITFERNRDFLWSIYAQNLIT